MPRAATPPKAAPVYLTCGEVDRSYRLRVGTAVNTCNAGLIPCAPREVRGRRTYLIRLQDAEAKWGAK